MWKSYRTQSVKYTNISIFLGAIYLALFAAIFSALANATYIWSVLKGNFKAAGAAIAHTGFAIMVIGMQLFLAGFVAELVTRNATDRNTYLIDEKLGIN